MSHKLLSKNFVLLILGQVSSLFGNLILRLALSMYVLELTGSAAIFAGLLSATTIPTILLSPFGGILADRANKRNIMVALDALTGISVLCSAVALSTDNALSVIGILLVLLSVLGAFETPTVQACIPTMLTGDDITKGNAVVNQMASISYLISPMLGSVLYVAFGLKPVMYASVLCFFLTALIECFIKLEHKKRNGHQNGLAMVKRDFSESIRFMASEQPGILKMLLVSALFRFFVSGITLVGLPYIVRTILELNAEYYGAAESMLAVATIAGSIAAGVLIGKLKTRHLSFLLTMIGASVIPAGIVFLLPTDEMMKYVIIVAAFCGMQIMSSVFSIFAVSMIQQKTPNHLIGKVMAYTVTITMCAQPIGQTIYGLLFDRFSDAIHLVLIPTGTVVCIVGLLAKDPFRTLN